MSSLAPGEETNAGLTYKLLCEMAPSANLSIRYEAGVQWKRWRDILDVIEGRGINRQIRRAYGYLASRYRPGDRIFLLGYSRGAYAVRSLAGVIDRVGLLKSEHATVTNIRTAYRHYQNNPNGEAAKAFVNAKCHSGVQIEMVGVWDSVKSLGLRIPVLWRFAKPAHEFHNHTLGHTIRNGFHALALDETRMVYAPVMWESRPDWHGRLEQTWFRGTHGDVGGHLGNFLAARPLANIPLVWMLERIEYCGITLPDRWRDRFWENVHAPSVGMSRGWSRLFVIRKKRQVGRDKSEQFHKTVLHSMTSS